MQKKIVFNKTDNSILLKKTNNTVELNGPLGKVNLFPGVEEEKFFIKEAQLQNFLNAMKTNLLGVSKGWFLELNLVGTGYKVFYYKDRITLDLGYSNLITFKITNSLKVKILKNKIVLFSPSKSYLYDLALKLKNLKKIDRYKGKGLLYKNEKIILKQGKLVQK